MPRDIIEENGVEEATEELSELVEGVEKTLKEIEEFGQDIEKNTLKQESNTELPTLPGTETEDA